MRHEVPFLSCREVPFRRHHVSEVCQCGGVLLAFAESQNRHNGYACGAFQINIKRKRPVRDRPLCCTQKARELSADPPGKSRRGRIIARQTARACACSDSSRRRRVGRARLIDTWIDRGARTYGAAGRRGGGPKRRAGGVCTWIRHPGRRGRPGPCGLGGCCAGSGEQQPCCKYH
jgi:hypothetical protein